MKRKNNTIEALVTKGIELASHDEYINAAALMKFNGVPNHVIGRVLYDQEKVREEDLNLLSKKTKKKQNYLVS